MSRLHRLVGFCRDSRGSAVVEFALLAPLFLATMLGVVQAGRGFQHYSAMRELSADTARYMLVNSTVPNATVGTTFTTKASQAPYMLRHATVTVSNATVQRYSGSLEKTITVTANFGTLLDWTGIEAPTMTYTQAVFVCDSC